jgi:hypothetical protein
MLYRLNAANGLTESLDLRDFGFGDVFVGREDTRTMAHPPLFLLLDRTSSSWIYAPPAGSS